MKSEAFDKHFNRSTHRLHKLEALVRQIEAICDEGHDELHSQSSLLAEIALDEMKAMQKELQKLWDSQVKSKQ